MDTYIVQLGHDSSVFNYYPFGDPYSSSDYKSGWAPVNDITGGYDPLSNITDLSEGASSHKTLMDGAVLELYFRGSSLTLLGEVDECSFDIWLDGSTSTGMPGNGRLAEFSQLNNAYHRMLMTVHPSSVNGSISFRGATLEVTPWNEGAQIGYTDGNVTYGQDWSQQFNPILGAYHETTTLGTSINMTLHQASAIVVYGIRGPDYGRFNVTLDNLTTTYLGKSSFFSHSVLFAATDLDSNFDHQLTLTHIENSFAISSINITTTTGGHPPSSERKISIPRGTLIAIATVGFGILTILILTTLYVVIQRRMRARSRLRNRFVQRPPSVPSMAYDDTFSKSYRGPESVILIANSRTSFGDSDHGEDGLDEEDASYHFVRRPFLGSTPSIRMPNLGPQFQLDFSRRPGDQSDQVARRASKRSRPQVEHGHEQPIDHSQDMPSDTTELVYLQDTSHSTDHSKHSSEGEKHRSRVRFSTPAFTQLFKPSGTRLGRRSYSRSSRGTAEPTSPVESEPFTVGTSVAFDHPDSTPSNSMDQDRSMSHAREISQPMARTDVHGFIPISGGHQSSN